MKIIKVNQSKKLHFLDGVFACALLVLGITLGSTNVLNAQDPPQGITQQQFRDIMNYVENERRDLILEYQANPTSDAVESNMFISDYLGIVMADFSAGVSLYDAAALHLKNLAFDENGYPNTTNLVEVVFTDGIYGQDIGSFNLDDDRLLAYFYASPSFKDLIDELEDFDGDINHVKAFVNYLVENK